MRFSVLLQFYFRLKWFHTHLKGLLLSVSQLLMGVEGVRLEDGGQGGFGRQRTGGPLGAGLCFPRPRIQQQVDRTARGAAVRQPQPSVTSVF